MKDLSLKQLQDLGVNNFMSNKEIEKTLTKALESQQKFLDSPQHDNKPKELTLDDVLKYGGLFTYKLGKKSYKLNVLTKIDMCIIDNIENDVEAGVEYDITKAYRYHIRNSHDHYVTVKAKSYEEAQQVIDSIYSKGLYKVSCSVL